MFWGKLIGSQPWNIVTCSRDLSLPAFPGDPLGSSEYRAGWATGLRCLGCSMGAVRSDFAEKVLASGTRLLCLQIV